jgi:UDP-glucose 4-epimerase
MSGTALQGSRVFVTGGAGFIGSNLVDRLQRDGCAVTVYDNLSTGHRRFLSGALRSESVKLIEGDLLELSQLERSLRDHDLVMHLAANADVRRGTEHPRKDLEQNCLATWNVLEAMRRCGLNRLLFASTGSIYGEPSVFPTPEDAPFPVQTSLYGASKLAAEALVEAYCAGYGFNACIFRFVSILGERYTHGHVVDFYKKLQADPQSIEVLGNGKQRKSYLYIEDCIEGLLTGIEQATGQVSIFNLGANEYCSVDESLSWICEELGVDPRRQYTGGERGWIGDSPFIFLDCSRIRSLGWKPRLSIREAVIHTVRYIRANPWVLDRPN